MNLSVIFFKILEMCSVYIETKAVFTKKEIFFEGGSECIKMYWKKTEALFIKTKMNNEWNVYFLQNILDVFRMHWR